MSAVVAEQEVRQLSTMKEVMAECERQYLEQLFAMSRTMDEASRISGTHRSWLYHKAAERGVSTPARNRPRSRVQDDAGYGLIQWRGGAIRWRE